MRWDYLSRLSLAARWYLPPAEAAEGLEDYREIVEGRSEEELRRLYCLDKSTIARRAAKLEEAGYIRRLPNPEDKRRKQLFVTERGDALREAKVEAESFYFDWLTSDLEEAELAALVPLLDKLQLRSRDERRQNFCHLLEAYERTHPEEI